MSKKQPKASLLSWQVFDHSSSPLTVRVRMLCAGKVAMNAVLFPVTSGISCEVASRIPHSLKTSSTSAPSASYYSCLNLDSSFQRSSVYPFLRSIPTMLASLL